MTGNIALDDRTLRENAGALGEILVGMAVSR
jgi:hypothetical protein